MHFNRTEKDGVLNTIATQTEGMWNIKLKSR